jgi:hypothetical protein
MSTNQQSNDGFTVVKSRNSYKSSSSSPKNNNHYHSSRNTNTYNNSRNKSPTTPSPTTTTKPIKKISYEEQFPSMNSNNITQIKQNPINNNTNKLNFKIAIDKPITDILPIKSKNKIISEIIEEPEKYDLSLYVKLQERRQKEYDLIYGEGAFVNDRLNYERFDSDHESDDDDTNNNDNTDLITDNDELNIRDY